MQPDDDTRPDSELETLAAQGDKDALAELYARYHPRLYWHLQRYLPEPDAADVTQDTFIRVMKALTPKDERAAFSTWLFTIGRNLALNRRRRAMPIESSSDISDDHSIDRVADPDLLVNPEDTAELHEREALVWDAASGLGPREYSLFRLHWKEGLGPVEIGRIMGMSRAAVDTALSRVRSAMKSLIGCVLMLREGQRRCPELRSLLRTAHAVELSPYVRKLIEGHMRVCETCQQQHHQLTKPMNILGLALSPLALIWKKAGAATLPVKIAAATAVSGGLLAVGIAVVPLLTSPGAKGLERPPLSQLVMDAASERLSESALPALQLESTPTREMFVSASHGSQQAESAGVEAPAEPFPNGRMSVDCDAETRGIQKDCAYQSWEPFAIQVHIDPPSVGYSGLQTEIQWWSRQPVILIGWGEQGVKPLWPQCVSTRGTDVTWAQSGMQLSRFNCEAAGRSNQTYTGPVVEYYARCLSGTTEIALLAPDNKDQSKGTYLLASDVLKIEPALESATVTCGSPVAPPTPGAMAVDCNGIEAGIQNTCVGSSFDVDVHVTEAPYAGYPGFQFNLGWPGNFLVYVPTRNPHAEALIDCQGLTRVVQKAAVEYCEFPGPEEGTGTSAAGATGAVFRLHFECRSQGHGLLTLSPDEDRRRTGTFFIGSYEPPRLDSATIDCSGPGTPPPPPPPPEPAPTSPTGALSVDCEAETPDDIETGCEYSVDQTFSIQVYAGAAPEVGYLGFQTRFNWAEGVLRYLPTNAVWDEIRWADCDILPDRVGPAEVAGWQWHSPEPWPWSSVLLGCATGIGAPPSRAGGSLVELQFQCVAAGTTALTLVPGGPGHPLDTSFINPDSVDVVPDIANANITCSEPP